MLNISKKNEKMLINKSVLLFVLVLGAVIVSGCIDKLQPPTDKPYITDVAPDKSYGIEGENINVVVYVTNPTRVNYYGYVLIQADSPNCFGMNDVYVGMQKNIPGYNASISVLAGTTNSALLTMHIPTSNQATCYQPANHKLNVFLLQNGQILDSKTQIDFSLFQKK